jgi:hypothetical protein
MDPMSKDSLNTGFDLHVTQHWEVEVRINSTSESDKDVHIVQSCRILTQAPL